jgi:glycerol-3-phosphate dehydrogenase subunit C
MALRQEYPELFAIEGIEDVGSHTFEAVEYLRVHEDLAGEVEAADLSERDDDLAREFAYHAPCHARNQGIARQSVELFGDLDGVDVADVGDSCSGISGTYGWKAEKYPKSMAIGDEMFDHMEAAEGTTGMTECPTCAMQMEHGTGYEVRHPLELLAAALVD